MRRPGGARAVPRIVAVLAMIFAANAAGAETQAHDGGAQSQTAGRAADPAPQQEAAQEAGAGGGAAAEVPIKVYVAGTPEEPFVVAKIGDFPSELGEMGKEFLKREFLEHFIRDVLGMGGGGRAAALKVALLPQQEANEQEGSFTFGEVAGRITVRLAERHVFVFVSFEDKQAAAPTLLAAHRFAGSDARPSVARRDRR